MLLSELTDQLKDDVPAEDGVPSDAQYDNAVKDAIRDFSERCGVEQISTLAIVSGTATYDLPADFLKVIKLQAFGGQNVLYASNSQLIPVPAGWCERYTIRNEQITFYPTPTYTVSKTLRYKAAWIGTDTGDDYPDVNYATLGEREARIVLLKAQAIAMTKQVNAQSGDVLKYSLGAVSVDKGTNIDEKRKKSDKFDRDYGDACDEYNGQYVTYG